MGFDLATLSTIVPVRGLAAGKSRLARVLNPAERAALNRELLEHTLAIVREWSGAPQRTIVVSPCPHALALARKAGVKAVREDSHAAGHNHAVRLGIARAAARSLRHALVVSCDLPHISTDALCALVNGARCGKRVVLAPDKAGTGTNAVLVEIGVGFEFAFGPASLIAHQRSAECAGLAVSLVQHEDLQFDLDTPEDLACWTSAKSTGEARRQAV